MKEVDKSSLMCQQLSNDLAYFFRNHPWTWTPSTAVTRPRSPGGCPSVSAEHFKLRPSRPGEASLKMCGPPRRSYASGQPSTVLLLKANTTAQAPLPQAPTHSLKQTTNTKASKRIYWSHDHFPMFSLVKIKIFKIYWKWISVTSEVLKYVIG